MANEDDLKEALRACRAEIAELKREPAYGDRWRAWYRRTLAALRKFCGPESPELEGFLEIRFELGGPADITQRRIEKLAHPSLAGFEFSTDHYYLESFGARQN